MLLLNFENFRSKADFINAITATNYDLVVMDLYFRNRTEFTISEINQIRNKANGGKRLVFCMFPLEKPKSTGIIGNPIGTYCHRVGWIPKIPIGQGIIRFGIGI